MDAGAKGRRLLQRREYKAKVSEFIPKELEDQFSHDKNGELVFELDLKKIGGKLKSGLKKIFTGPVMKPNITKDQHLQKIRNQGGDPSHWANSFEPEGDMVEANSAQMKAMQDAKVKKMEDDKVSEKKKKKIDEKVEKKKQPISMKVNRLGGGLSQGVRTYDPALIGAVMRKRAEMAKKKKETKEEVQLEAKKSCGEGEYYCYDEQKCKPIPDGMKVGKDGMLVSEDMKGMSQKSGDKRSTESGAGMTAKGVAKYNRRTGGDLKTAVTTPPSKLKAGSKAAGRRKSFCARSKSWNGPRGKAARRRWNCSYEPEMPMIVDEGKKLFNAAPLSDRVAAWSKKITEGDTYVKTDRNKFGLPKDLKSVEKKVDKKVTGVNYGAMAQSYVPQGEVIAEKPGDGYLGPTVGKVGIPNPIRLAKDAVDQSNRANLKKVNTLNKIDPNTASMPKFKQFNKDTSAAYKNLFQSHKPEGDMVEAKVDQGKDDASKVNTRNQRAFGNRRGSKGGGHTGDDMEERRYNTKKGRGVKMRGKKDKTPINYKKRDRDKAVDELLGRTKKKEPTYLQKKGRQVDIKRKIKNKEGIFAEDMKEDFYRKKYDVKDGGYKKTNKMTKSNKRAGDSKAQNRELHKDLAKIKEGNLHNWFSGSKSKDGKGGWVNVVTGGTCASDKPGEGTPKCVSSSKRASMSKAERLSASRRKKKADPGQQSKSGAAKPTYVATDKKKKVDEMNQGPSTPVSMSGGKVMPNFGASRLGNVRLKNGKSLADLLKKV